MPDMSDVEEGDRLGRVQSLVRAFGLLDALAEHDGGATLTELATLSALPRSTVHRLLSTMHALRYVEFDSCSNRWMIGLQGFALGAAFVQTRDIGRLGRPIMRSLMLDANEVVNIAISGPNGIRYVGQVRPFDRVAASNSERPMLMHTTASGKVLMAHWSADELDGFLESGVLTKRTDASIVRVDSLIEELVRVRTRGFAIDDEENAKGVRCVAAPVFDCNNRIQASLSISGSCIRIPDQRLQSLGHTLAAAANRLSQEIGSVIAA